MKRHELKLRFRINEELSEEERTQALFRVFELRLSPPSPDTKPLRSFSGLRT